MTTTKESPVAFVREQAERLLVLLDSTKDKDLRVALMTLSLSQSYHQGFIGGVKSK